MKKLLSTLALVVLAQPALAAINATLYKSPTCGCCEEYAKYLEKNGFKVKAINSNDMSAIKAQYGSSNLASCHTTRVANYTVEGHVPVAAIQKLLREKPAIAGISAPGMPQNSPGMGPEIKGTLKIYQLGNATEPKLFSVE
ncbi:DUF411 domain-containing protein [Janthinobacterium sp. B9-8]|uniref:DUF411 domain-containing protein n=1 Tax=Janthinobacterium sp. B9-8 TaxID=1236179 RepID=UPI00061D2D72|nr:DUF411 domain-containing protein [Janthinobacterium sp. B9-8]AMC35036.1 CopG family transcriptional regulator [Janthinobacterium sp. B9-8]